MDQRRTTSALTPRRWIPDTSAAEETTAFLSTTACFRYRSSCPSNPESMIEHSTRIALARYKSILLLMSFISDDVTMITSSAVGQISLMIRYTMRRKLLSLDWNSFVTEKNTSVASVCGGEAKAGVGGERSASAGGARSIAQKKPVRGTRDRSRKRLDACFVTERSGEIGLRGARVREAFLQRMHTHTPRTRLGRVASSI